MDGEKLSASCRLWEEGMSVCRLLNALADAPKDEAVLDGLTASFQEVKPHLSNSLLKRITYLFSGADITPEDLRDAGARILKELAVSIGKCLGELLKKCPYVTRADAERLFPIWDEMPHTSSGDFQWMFYLCAKASVSMPAEAFSYTLKLFEEQPKLLSGEGAPHPSYVYRPSEQRTFDRCPICGGTGTPYYRVFSYRLADFAYPDLPAKLWMRCGGYGDLYTWKYPEEFLARAENAAWLEPRPENEWAATASTRGS